VQIRNARIQVLDKKPTARNESEVSAAPNARTIAIILKDKHWTVDELEKLARSRIWGQSGPPNGAVLQTMVHIYPHDQTNMCEFTYSAGFGKPFWRVKVGYDGRILRVEEGIKREARLSERIWRGGDS